MKGYQYLDIPITLTPMVASISLKGITVLRQGQFRVRHAGLKDVVQQPRTGFILKKTYDKLHPVAKKPVRKKKVVTERVVSSAVREYVIDKKKVTHRIHGYLNSMKGQKQLYLWTITFPKGTTDQTGYKLLQRWLDRMRKDAKLKEYLWIAERQQSGTVHYHLAVNQYIDVKKANRFMRSAIMRLIDSGDIQYSRHDASKYNGVDIAKNRKTGRVCNFAKQKHRKALAQYLTKYVSKSQAKFSHLAWHNSRGYSNIITAVNVTWDELSKSGLRPWISTDDPLRGEFFTFFRWKGQPPDKVLRYLETVNKAVSAILHD